MKFHEAEVVSHYNDETGLSSFFPDEGFESSLTLKPEGDTVQILDGTSLEPFDWEEEHEDFNTPEFREALLEHFIALKNWFNTFLKASYPDYELSKIDFLIHNYLEEGSENPYNQVDRFHIDTGDEFFFHMSLGDSDCHTEYVCDFTIEDEELIQLIKSKYDQKEMQFHHWLKNQIALGNLSSKHTNHGDLLKIYSNSYHRRGIVKRTGSRVSIGFNVKRKIAA